MFTLILDYLVALSSFGFDGVGSPSPSPTEIAPALPPSPVQGEALQDAAEAGFWEKFATGPPMAGIFALCAAGVAYAGIHRQVTKSEEANVLTDKSNKETERKNTEDQWWSTLKWAYSEAKDFKASKNQDDTVAVVAILSSLAAQKDLSDLQLQTVSEVTNLFDGSSSEVVQASVERTRVTVDAASDSELWRSMGVQYEVEVGSALRLIGEQLGARVIRTPRAHRIGLRSMDLIPDWVIESPDNQLIAVEAKFRRGKIGRQVFEHAHRYVGAQLSTPSGDNEGTIGKILIVANQEFSWQLDESFAELDGVMGRVTWGEGDSPAVIEAALISLMEQNPQIN